MTTSAAELLPSENGDPSTSPKELKRPNWIYIVELVTDERGALPEVRRLIIFIFSVGALLSIILPKDPNLNGFWYPIFSACIGYTYFFGWSISFYPQMLLNWHRKSTVGLSYDFCILNVIGYACYSVYNCALYWSPSIREEYRRRHDGMEALVEPNDVAFALHAIVMSSIWIMQILWYDPDRRPSPWIAWACIATIIFIVGDFFLTAVSGDWLTFFYLLSSVKVVITVSKYIPQALLNFERKSTSGWNIWNIVLDLTGGFLSLLQLVLDGWNLKDWGSVFGNPAKLGISFVTVFFDFIFVFQHYVLYKPHPHLDHDYDPEAEMEPIRHEYSYQRSLSTSSDKN